MELLRPAATDFRFLLSRKYPRKSALNFVGNHYQLSSVERNLLYRSVFTRAVARKRRAKTVRIGELAGRKLVIDGYNCLITLENALKEKALVLADDGFVRDTGLVFRGFRQSALTRKAWFLVTSVLKRYRPSFVHVMLDEPYARSGELAVLVNRWMAEEGVHGHAETTRNTERQIAAMEGIKATADSNIIDHADMVFDMAGHVIRYILKKRLIRM